MRLTVQYVRKTKAGTWEYRRKVPKGLVESIGSLEFKQVLGKTAGQAQRNYLRFHDQVEATILQAQKPTLSKITTSTCTPLDIYREAIATLKALGIDPTEAVHSEPEGNTDMVLRVALRDEIVSKYPEDDEGHAKVSSPVDTMAIKLLAVGPEEKAPTATVEDASRIYIEEKGLRDPKEKKNLQRVKRVVSEIKSALGKNPKLTDLKRADAREVRDYMLNEADRSPETVERYLNDVRAIINMGLKEFDLQDHSNPFMGLNVPKNKANESKVKRDPLPKSVRSGIRSRILGNANSELQLIWRLLEATGCRLAEVVGLRIEDVVAEGVRPHVKVEWHDERRVKDEVTIRWVPLIGDGLSAASEALKAVEGRNLSGPLFVAYGRQGGPDAASAALMRHVRKITKNPKHVVHSLRHNMKDLLKVAGVSVMDQNLVLGHTIGGAGEGYGSREADLEVMYRAMAKAAEEKQRTKQI